MSMASICKRLIWKEARESALLVGLGIAAPAIFWVVTDRKIVQLQWILIVLLVATVIGVFLWAAEKANVKRSRNDFEDAYLVMPRIVDWVASFVFPALIAFGVGAWLGYTLSTAPGWSQSHWSRTQLWTALSSGLLLLSGFLVCYVASRAFGFLSGVIVGVVWLLYPGIRLIIPVSPDMTVDPGPDIVMFMVRAAVGVVLGSALLAAASRSGLYARFQFVPVALAAALCLGPGLQGVFPSLSNIESKYANYAVLSRSSSDRSLTVEPTGKRSRMSVSLRLTSWRNGTSWERSFHQAVQLVAATGRVVYLAQQGIGEDCVRIVAWDAATNKIICRSTIPVGKNAVLNCRPGVASPDGRFVMFFLGTAVGQGHDLWAVNTVNGAYRVLATNTSPGSLQVQWTEKHAILSCGEIRRIRLADFRPHVVEIHAPSEVKQ